MFLSFHFHSDSVVDSIYQFTKKINRKICVYREYRHRPITSRDHSLAVVLSVVSVFGILPYWTGQYPQKENRGRFLRRDALLNVNALKSLEKLDTCMK